jgi:hypothetical protein
MRDAGEVSLPFTVSKEAFMKDLLYYGFENVNPKNIVVAGSVVAFKASYDHIDAILDSEERVTLRYMYRMLAHYCVRRFRMTGSLRVYIHQEIDDDDPLREFPCAKVMSGIHTAAGQLIDGVSSSSISTTGERKEWFREELEVFGLKVKSTTYDGYIAPIVELEFAEVEGQLQPKKRKRTDVEA